MAEEHEHRWAQVGPGFEHGQGSSITRRYQCMETGCEARMKEHYLVPSQTVLARCVREPGGIYHHYFHSEEKDGLQPCGQEETQSLGIYPVD